jgi:hypothetical protein
VTTPPPEDSLLDRRTLNRTLLARQQLLARVAMPVADMIEHLVGLEAQVPRDPYISLWSRLRDFQPAALERLLLEREAVRMTLMRTTLHLVTARDAPRLRAAMQAVCERGFGSSPFRRQLDGIDLDALLAAGTAAVEDRPRTVAELGAVLAELWPTHDRTALAYAVRYLVPLVQVTPRGLLRRSAAPRVTTLYAWLGEAARVDTRADSRLEEVVLRYLRAFGPATVADVRAWSWLSDVRSVVELLRPRLRSYRDGAGRELFDVEDGVFAAPDEPAPVRFTGEYDNVFLAHADRSRVTGDLAWGEAYLRKGAFFVDGFLAGSWVMTVSKGHAVVTLEPRRLLDRRERDAAATEAEALVEFLAPDAPRRRLAWAAG